jgi:hypothetical protein
LPTNFGDIAHHHRRIAARYRQLALIARSCGRIWEADYLEQLAARYFQAAQEQKAAMRHEPGALVENRKLRPWTLIPEPGQPASTGWAAIRRLPGRLAGSIRRFISRRSVPIQGVSLN